MQHRTQSDLQNAPMTTTGKALKTPGGWALGWGDTMPADASRDWAPGAIFLSSGSDHVVGHIFENQGTATSSLFRRSGTKQQFVTKAANYTLTAQDSGKVFLASAADVVFTLPSTENGLFYTIINGVLSSGVGIAYSPAAADRIIGPGLTGVDNKDLINSGATDVVGDTAIIVGDGSDGWWITSLMGTWAKEA